MKEAIDQCAIWEETSEDTFVRFSQFVYTGNYDGVKPRKRDPELVTSVVNKPSRPVDMSQRPRRPLPPPLVPPPDKDKKARLCRRFQSLYPEPVPELEFCKNEPGGDYTDVFLSHAQMYVFADYHGIDALQTLALRKLRQELTNFSLFNEGSRDITQLVRYSFENTVEEGDNSDALRGLICHYAACQVEILWKSKEFQGLLDSVNDFSKGLIAIMLDRLD